jgi:2-iminobutanoate/2-iminopropanoate deaminase
VSGATSDRGGGFLTLRNEAARARTASDMVSAGDFAFVSGVLPIDLDDDRRPLSEYIEEQTEQCLANLEAIIARAGLGRDAVVSVHIAMTDLPQLYERMNGRYEGFFAAGRLPTRSCVGVAALPRGAQIQMDFVIRLIGG